MNLSSDVFQNTFPSCRIVQAELCGLGKGTSKEDPREKMALLWEAVVLSSFVAVCPSLVLCISFLHEIELSFFFQLYISTIIYTFSCKIWEESFQNKYALLFIWEIRTNNHAFGLCSLEEGDISHIEISGFQVFCLAANFLWTSSPLFKANFRKNT